MKNEDLVNLNFHKLLNYGGMPEVRYRYDDPIKCKGYCIAC